MKFTLWTVTALGTTLWLLPSQCDARGRIGGARVGGVRAGGVRASGYRTRSASVGHYGGSATRSRSGYSARGPLGGTSTRRSGSGSYTTPRGGSIQYGGAARGRTGPLGGASGRYAGGVRVTTPGGRTATKVGAGGAARGPGGRTVAGSTGASRVTGYRGSLSTRYKNGVAIGPGGAVAGGGRTTVARTRTGVAGGAYGVAAGGARTVRTSRGRVAAVGGGAVYGTRYVSRTSLRTRGTVVRRNFRYYGTFTRSWYVGHPSAWRATRWVGGAIWAPVTWGVVASYCSFPPQPVYYDYGTTITINDSNVYQEGTPIATTEQYASQATEIAETGAKAQVNDDDAWQPLGVFALVEGDEETSYDIFQFAVNKSGVIRGNYYNARNDESEMIQGSVDKKTQRAAWTIGKKTSPVYEVGIANLTKDETTILAHFGKDDTRQLSLVRIEKPEDQKEE